MLWRSGESNAGEPLLLEGILVRLALVHNLLNVSPSEEQVAGIVVPDWRVRPLRSLNLRGQCGVRILVKGEYLHSAIVGIVVGVVHHVHKDAGNKGVVKGLHLRLCLKVLVVGIVKRLPRGAICVAHRALGLAQSAVCLDVIRLWADNRVRLVAGLLWIIRIRNFFPHLMDVLDDEWEVPVVGEIGRIHEILVWLRVEQTQAVELAIFRWSQEQLRTVLGELTGFPLSEKSRHD